MANMNIPFDTLDYAKKLESAGVPINQAEQQSKLLADVLGAAVVPPAVLDSVKHDLIAKIEATALRLDAKIEESGLRFDAKIEATEHRLDAKIEATEHRLDTKIEATALRLDAKIEATALRLESRFNGQQGEINLLKWMLATTIAMNLAIFLKLFIH